MKKDLDYCLTRYGFFRGFVHWVKLSILTPKKIAKKLSKDDFSDWNSTMLEHIGISKKKVEAQKTLEEVVENLLEKTGGAAKLSELLAKSLQSLDGVKGLS